MGINNLEVLFDMSAAKRKPAKDKKAEAEIPPEDIAPDADDDGDDLPEDLKDLVTEDNDSVPEDEDDQDDQKGRR